FGRLKCDPDFSEYVELFKRMLLAKEPKDVLVQPLKMLFKIIHPIYYINKLIKESNEGKLFDACLDENNEDYEKRITTELLDKHVHLQLCLISRKLNKVLQVQMSIQMVWYFYDALAICLMMYDMITAYRYIWNFFLTFAHLCGYFNFVLRTILFLTLHYICQTINETVAILHKLSSYNLDEDLRKQIWQFMLQIKQREVKFGLGHFYFGYNFICWELKICLRELAIVDHTLEAFGTPKEYQSLRSWTIRIIIGLIVYVCYIVTYNAFFISFEYVISWGVILDIFLLYYPYNVVALSALISAAILGLVL
ncbi:hypothetical protein ALC57_13324, partial [Trachymyrmex cornetzi]